MDVLDLLPVEDKVYIKSLTAYLDDLMDYIYTDNKKNYLFYIKKLNEIDEIYTKYLDIVHKLLINIKNYCNKEKIEPRCLNVLSGVFLSLALIKPIFLLPSSVCQIRAIDLTRKSFFHEYKKDYDNILKPILEIESRFKNYVEVIINIMNNYINYDESKGYIDSNDILEEDEIYNIANSFIALLLYDKETVDIDYAKEEVINKVYELLQSELDTDDNNLDNLLDIASNTIYKKFDNKSKTLQRKK